MQKQGISCQIPSKQLQGTFTLFFNLPQYIPIFQSTQYQVYKYNDKKQPDAPQGTALYDRRG